MLDLTLVSLKKIAKDMGVTLDIKEMDFDSLLPALKTNKIDMIISGMSPTPERLKEVDFSDPYMTVQQKSRDSESR